MIQGRHIHLRAVREQDLGALYEQLNDLSTRGEHFPIRLTPEPTFRAQFQENGFWSDAYGRLLICDARGRVVGSIWYFQPAPYYDGVEIGYHLFDVGSRGKGYTSEALAMLVDFLFGTRKIHRLQLTVTLGNEASRRVAMKAGFTSEGSARGAVFLHGENRDIEVFSLLRTDPRPSRSEG